jgi:DNA helicase-2/ATP-dependent DNA helicase PcrA
MLILTLKIMQEDASVTDRLRHRYPFVQIDEAQDTSKVQHEILKRLVFPSNNLFIVADDDQAIYGFRGASPDLLLSFQTQFPGGKLYHLATNYRSREEIIKVCAFAIQNNLTRYQKELSAIRGPGGTFRLKEFETYADRNKALLQDLMAFPESSTGILYRNHLSGLSVMDALLEAGLDFRIEAGRRTISEHWLVKDMEAFYRLSQSPEDLESFLRIVYKTELRLTREAVETIKLNHRGRDVFQVALEALGRKGYASDRIKRVQTDISQLKNLRAPDFLETVDGALGYSGYLKYAETSLGQSPDHIRSLWFSLLAIADRFSSPADFFARLKALDQYRGVEGAARISLSTLHASKGREFDRVKLIDVVTGIFPKQDTFKTEAERLALEEERRLFYVGISRARESVDLYHARFGGGRRLRLSTFVDEILPVIEQIRPPKSQPATDPVSETLMVGSSVQHLKFGAGKVAAIHGDALTLLFEDKTRTLSLRLCLEKGFLTF